MLFLSLDGSFSARPAGVSIILKSVAMISLHNLHESPFQIRDALGAAFSLSCGFGEKVY
jgi:hypothetical protein